MPVINKPFFDLLYIGAQLAPKLGLGLGFRSLVFGIFAECRTSRCEPRQTVPCLRAEYPPGTLQRKASFVLVRRPLTAGAFLVISTTPLSGLIGAQSKIVTGLGSIIFHPKKLSLF